jgi:septal ring factor EnvC (AmiA/AmiB activator)
LDDQVSLVEQIASSDSFSDFVDQSEYLNTMRGKVQETTDKIVSLKKDLEQQRTNLENKKKEIESLKAQQEIKKGEIDSQKAIKEKLLAQVGADEAKYQALIGNLQGQVSSMQAEIARVAAAASTPRGIFGGGYKSYGHVNKGDIIGYQGNSGYSTGTHLHFELRINGADTNPWPYVLNGTFTNPLPGSRINQYWGETGNLAGYYRHTGMDLAAYYGAPVHAAADGEIIARVTGYGNTYPGQVSYGNYVMIRHSNGWVTIYGHLQ